MKLDWLEIRVLLVKLENLFGSRHCFHASHQDVSFIEIRSELLDCGLRNRFIDSSSVENDDRAETDRLEVALFLRLLQRILIYDFPIERPAVFSEWRGGELQYFPLLESRLEGTPRRGLSMVGLVDEQVGAMGCHAVLNRRLALPGDTARRDDDVAPSK